MWKTICSADSAQDIEKMINSYYCSDDYLLGEEINDTHFSVINTKTLRKDKNIVRFYKKKMAIWILLDSQLIICYN